MGKNKSRIAKLNSAFLNAACTYMEHEKRMHLLKTKDGEQLHRSEIHVVSEIKENEGIYMTALAEKLSVTLGAVSQILAKLEKKGLIMKEKDSQNQSRYLLKLTPAGELVHINHMKFHEEFDHTLIEILDNESEEKIDFLRDFLTKLRNKMLNFS